MTVIDAGGAVSEQMYDVVACDYVQLSGIHEEDMTLPVLLFAL